MHFLLIYLLVLGEREREIDFVVPLIYAVIGWFLYVPWPGITPWSIRMTLSLTELPGQGQKNSILKDINKPIKNLEIYDGIKELLVNT